MNTNTLTKRLLLAALLALALLGGQAAAQTAQATSDATHATAAATEKGVRFTATGEVLQIRLEIYTDAGEMVFDSGPRAGGVLDWKADDAPRALADGSYLCAVTFKGLSGRNVRRLARLDLQSGRASLARARSSELSAAQSQSLASAAESRKIESNEADDSLTILREGRERAATVATHDGRDGQLTSTSGALTLRTGDVFTGRDREQMRVTPEGRVGIGTDNPEATLDVAGTIRARGGIRFEDGTVLTSAGRAAQASRAAAGDSPTPNIVSNSTGTANRLSKWLDGAGTLGDSAVAEVNGNVGIGTPSPASMLHLAGPSGVAAITFNTPGSQRLRFQTVPNVPNWGALTLNSNYSGSGWLLDDPSTNGWFFKLDTRGGNASGNSNGLWLYRVPAGSGPHTDEAPVFGVSSGHAFFAGNVGVGVDAPGQRLEVVGNVKVSGAGNGVIFSDGSKMTTANGVAGATPSGTNIISAINDPATAGMISDNRLSPNVARLGGANAWSGSNVFGTGLSANGAQVTNVGNPVAGTDAANKAYVDSTTVRFVPGAEQLSVGDANGTAAMINLRGGSTCCSGPGGHMPAFFKVFQNGSFVATGNLGIGVSPMEGKGYRTSWYTYKGAFRSGYADNEWDDLNTGFFSWAGGSNSTASGLYSFSFGDTNYARSTSSIAFGSGNEVKGAAGFSAGAGNRVCDTYGLAFGNKAQSGGPLVNGLCDPDSFNIHGLAAVAIGYNVTADQDHTMAFGKFASNNGFSGTFVWSDASATASADTFKNTANNEFAARATGGFRFRTNLTGTTGCNLPAGSGVFNCTSSRYTKENFSAVGGEDVLARLRKVPVSSWNYISEGRQVRHLGPMAEDFYSAFGLGTGNTSIGVQDLAGVSLAAAKALDQRTAELQKENAQLRAQLTSLEQRLAALEQGVKTNVRGQQTKSRRR